MLERSNKPSTAADLVKYFEDRGIKFANADTIMKIYGVRLHLRVLRRLSLAVLDPAQPKYEYSGLYYMDRNEELFGRLSPQMSMQEAPRIFDSFQSSLSDLNDLRMACENLHVLWLRGSQLKLSLRTVQDTARCLPLYSKIPKAIALADRNLEASDF